MNKGRVAPLHRNIVNAEVGMKRDTYPQFYLDLYQCVLDQLTRTIQHLQSQPEAADEL